MASKVSLNIFHIICIDIYVYVLGRFYFYQNCKCFLYNLIVCYLHCPFGPSFRFAMVSHAIKIIRITQRLIADKVKWIARKLFRAIYNHDWYEAVVAILWCIAAQCTRIQRTWSTPLARNPSDSLKLYLYLTYYTAGIKEITVYRYLFSFFLRKFT